MQNLVAELEIMPSVDRYQLYDYLREMRDSLEEIAEMRGLDHKMAENTRICRIGNACFLAALKEANFRPFAMNEKLWICVLAVLVFWLFCFCARRVQGTINGKANAGG